MKYQKQLIAGVICAAIVLSNFSLRAQNTYPYPSTGSIGIGTTTPTELLHVAGQIRVNKKVVGDVTHAYVELSSTAGSRLNWGTGGQQSSFEAGGPATIWTNNLERVRVASNGYVGIGTSSVLYNLHLSGAGNTVQLIESTVDGYATLQFKGNGTKYEWAKTPSAQGDRLELNYFNGAWQPSYMVISSAGKVGIGTGNFSAGYKLFVEEGIRTRKVKVDQSTWADFVFHPSYSLRPLADVEKFIKQYQHLPDVPSAKEVEENGLNLGDNQAVLLRKIEELTLYVIEQQKQLQDLKREVERLKSSNTGNK